MKTFTPSKNLKSILKKGQNYNTEFKEKVDKTLSREIVAFANSSGGQIYLGITNEGKVKGINITNRLKSQIKNIAKKCDPQIPISFQEIKKEKVLVVEVEESDDKPHCCPERFYTRSGAYSRELKTSEILEFIKEEQILKFDTLPCKKFSFKKDFDKKKLFSFMDRTEIKYKKRDYIKLLEDLKVVKRKDSEIIFNNAGALFFSKDLDRIHPHAEISCALFKGTDKHHDIIDRKIFIEDIIKNIEDSMNFLIRNLRLEYKFPTGQLRREEVLEIPEEALQEALVNVVTHRDYSFINVSSTVEIFDDRVEIYNFGVLPKGLKRSEFGKKSVPRNSLIADLMLKAKYMKGEGTGVKKMRSLVRKAGLKPIKFEFSNFTTVTFYRKPLPGGNYIS